MRLNFKIDNADLKTLETLIKKIKKPTQIYSRISTKKRATPLESLFNLLNLNAFAVGEGLEPPGGG